MISVVIPSLNAATRLPLCLDALVGAAASGLVKEVVIVDGGSADKTRDIAEGFGAMVISAPPGRGGQLKAGANAARGAWLLFLHADTVLEAGWAEEARAHMKDFSEQVAVFTLAFDAKKSAARFVSSGAMIRTQMLKLPYGDQGLLISRKVYDDIGGYGDLPLFEDVDFARRLVKAKGRSALRVLSARATTSAERYERLGYLRCVISNQILMVKYLAGAAPEELAKEYR
ncbi:MAG: TIGR04283 family arsenosugar biosynthesis glycosyltransferase [Pseudomonadota bacterium]